MLAFLPCLSLLSLAAADGGAGAGAGATDLVEKAGTALTALEKGPWSYRVEESGRGKFLREETFERDYRVYRRGRREKLSLLRSVRNGEVRSEEDLRKRERIVNSDPEDPADWATGEPLHPADRRYYDYAIDREEEVAGRRCQVLRLTPRMDNERLFRGYVWIDADGFPLKAELVATKPPKGASEMNVWRRYGRAADAAVLVEERVSGRGRWLLVSGTGSMVRRFSDWKPGDAGPDALFDVPPRGREEKKP
jgi:hypothetical protein